MEATVRHDELERPGTAADRPAGPRPGTSSIRPYSLHLAVAEGSVSTVCIPRPYSRRVHISPTRTPARPQTRPFIAHACSLASHATHATPAQPHEPTPTPENSLAGPALRPIEAPCKQRPAIYLFHRVPSTISEPCAHSTCAQARVRARAVAHLHRRAATDADGGGEGNPTHVQQKKVRRLLRDAADPDEREMREARARTRARTGARARTHARPRGGQRCTLRVASGTARSWGWCCARARRMRMRACGSREWCACQCEHVCVGVCTS